MMWGQFSQVKVKVLYRTVFTSDTSPNSGILRSLTLLTNLSPKVYNLLRTQERAIIMINYSCITKDTNEEQPNEDMHRMISGKVLNVKVVPSTGESLEIQMAKFFMEFRYVSMIDWITGPMTKPSSASLPSQKVGIILCHPLITWLDFPEWLTTSWNYPEVYHESTQLA